MPDNLSTCRLLPAVLLFSSYQMSHQCLQIVFLTIFHRISLLSCLYFRSTSQRVTIQASERFFAILRFTALSANCLRDLIYYCLEQRHSLLENTFNHIGSFLTKFRTTSFSARDKTIYVADVGVNSFDQLYKSHLILWWVHLRPLGWIFTWDLQHGSVLSCAMQISQCEHVYLSKQNTNQWWLIRKWQIVRACFL